GRDRAARPGARAVPRALRAGRPEASRRRPAGCAFSPPAWPPPADGTPTVLISIMRTEESWPRLLHAKRSDVPMSKGKLARGQGTAIEKRRHHRSSRRVSDQSRDFGDDRACNHFRYLTPESVDEHFTMVASKESGRAASYLFRIPFELIALHLRRPRSTSRAG